MRGEVLGEEGVHCVCPFVCGLGTIPNRKDILSESRSRVNYYFLNLQHYFFIFSLHSNPVRETIISPTVLASLQSIPILALFVAPRES